LVEDVVLYEIDENRNALVLCIAKRVGESNVFEAEFVASDCAGLFQFGFEIRTKAPAPLKPPESIKPPKPPEADF
jgi:hypothetical protein